MIRRRDVFYKIIQNFQEESTNSFIKNYDTDDAHSSISWIMTEIMQNNIDSCSHEELQTLFKVAIEKHFKLLEEMKK